VNRLPAPAGLIVASIVIAPVAELCAQPERDALLDRVGQYVEAYYNRAQSLLTEETVTMQPLARDLTSDGFARRLTYEARVEWDPTSGEEATVVRQLLRVNGRPPRERDEPRCTDPRTLSPEPLAALLPRNQGDYTFRLAGAAEIGDRRAALLEYVRTVRQPPQVDWDDECAHIELPSDTRTRVWVDPLSGEVLRLDERLIKQVEIAVPREQQRLGAARFMNIERVDMSIRYAPVTFQEPDERLLLPSTIETLVVIQNSGSPRMRITQSFGRYRRFVTGSRIVRE
jgi:hypothetical protein